MKKMFILFLAGMLLAGCERPATLTDWSPISATQPAGADTPQGPNATIPPLDWGTFPEQLPKSMKGYELVSWQVDEGWNYTLITGTNREKTFEELISPGNTVDENGYVKLTVSGLPQIKQVISHLPAGEQIIWSGITLDDQVTEGTLYFAYPPHEVILELFMYCQERGIDLITTQTQDTDL